MEAIVARGNQTLTAAQGVQPDELVRVEGDRRAELGVELDRSNPVFV